MLLLDPDVSPCVSSNCSSRLVRSEASIPDKINKKKKDFISI